MSVRLVQTCGGCPEQYDAFIGDLCVGYLRLRLVLATVSNTTHTRSIGGAL